MAVIWMTANYVQEKNNRKRKIIMRIYISGKIGEEVLSEATRQKFAKAQKELEAKGYEVFNPTCDGWQNHLIRCYGKDIQQTLPPPGGPISKYTYYLLRDLMTLATMDAIYMLKDWEDSFGARTELMFAMTNGLHVIFEDEYINLDKDMQTSVAVLMEAAKSVNGNVSLTLENCNGWDVTLKVEKAKGR